MATTDDPRDTPPISPELRRAIAADRIGCFVDEEVLGDKDTKALKAILRGELKPDFPVNRKRAMATLARSDPSPETADILGNILTDRRAPKGDPAAAAALLGQLPQLVAERPLLAALPAASGPLQVEILEALGRTGSTEALAALDKLDLPEDDPAERPLALARMLVKLRADDYAVTPKELDEALDIRWSEAKSAPLGEKDLRRIAATLPPRPYGIEPNTDIGFGFTCGEAEHAVLLNAELERGKIAHALTARGRVAALVVTRPERVEHYVVRWVLLTVPDRREVRMVLVRPNGEPALVGTATAEEWGLAFTLRDTGVERMPAEITGRIAEDEIGWTIRTWEGPLRAKRNPLPLTLSANR